MTGQIIDNILEVYPQKLTRVGESQDREEFALSNAKETISVRANKDDIIVESNKIYDRETEKYIEINKNDVLDLTEKCVSIISDTLSFKQDFRRAGIIFEFRIPKWDDMEVDEFSKFIHKKFMDFESAGNISEGGIRFAYKLSAPGGGVLKKLKDYRNVIIRVEESVGIDENGERKECLFVSVDIQHIFDPSQNAINVKEHYKFAKEHLTSVLLPEFKNKGVEINYE